MDKLETRIEKLENENKLLKDVIKRMSDIHDKEISEIKIQLMKNEEDLLNKLESRLNLLN